MKHKPYPKYKPSGIDWIGDIPEGWKIERLANIGIFSSSGIDKKINENEPLVSMVNYTDIYGNEARVLRQDREYMVVSCPEAKRLIHQVEYGDLMFTPSSETIEDIGLSAVVDEDLPNTVFSYHVVRFVFQKNVSHEFKKYLCNNYFVLNQFSRLANGTTRQILGRFDFRSTLVAVPPIEEQQQIANFLDQKTAQIDDLIQKKEEMVKLLKEKRAAVINQAVTKGLDPNAKMKPSGIDWIGDIPEGWDVRRLKFIASTKFSNVDKHAKEEEQPVSLCNYVDVYYNDFIDSNMDFMQATATNDEIRKFALNKGDVIVTKDSESWDDIAIPAYVKEDMHGVLCGYHLAIIQANQNICGEYIFWSFLSQIINYQFQVSATGVTRYGLGKGSIDNAMFFVPSKKEQHQIANYLDKKTTEIDGLINKIESAIAKLREYRSSLITAAVTGKIDVRGAVKC